MTAVAAAPRASHAPTPADVLAVLEGAEPGAGVTAVHAMWPGGTRDTARARIRAAIHDPAVRDSPVAQAWARRLRNADRNLSRRPDPVPSRVTYDRLQGWHETDPEAVEDHVDHALTTYYGDRP